MGDDAHAVLEMVKDQYGFGEAENGLRQVQLIAFRNGQTLEARRHFVGQVADRAAVKYRQFVGVMPVRSRPGDTVPIRPDEVERVVAGNLLKRKRAVDAVLPHYRITRARRSVAVSPCCVMTR